jgi:lysophospholipase L1-like esterase
MPWLLLWIAACVGSPSPVAQAPSTNDSDEVPLGDSDDSDDAVDDTVDHTSERLYVLGFGDSVTKGYCASAGHSYLELLANNDDDLYPNWQGRDLASKFESVDVDNSAINGTTSCDYTSGGIDDAVQAWLSEHTFAADRVIVVITLGGNDLLEPYGCGSQRDCAVYCSSVEEATPWSNSYKQRMIRFIEAFQDGIPGQVDVFLADIYDPTDEVGDIENAEGVDLPAWPEGFDVHAMYNQRISEVADATGAHLVNMRQAMLGHGIHHDDMSNPYYDPNDPSYWYCSNLEDPNDLGYHAIRGAFWAEMEKQLGM